MNKYISYTIFFLIVCSMFSTMFFVFERDTTVKADPLYDELVLWFTSDHHYGYNWGYGSGDVQFPIAINDVRDNTSLSVDWHFSAGDQTNAGGSGDWDDYYADEDILETDILNGNGSRSMNATGNHENGAPAGWDDESGHNKAWNRTIGNVMVIGINVISLYSRSYNTDGQMEWLNTTVQNNQDKIIIILLHHMLYDTTFWWEDQYATPSADFLWLLNNYNVDMVCHGHAHQTATTGELIINNYGSGVDGQETLHVYVGSIQINMIGSTAVGSRFLIFDDASDQVRIRSRNHSDSSWYSIPEDGGVLDADGQDDGYFTWDLSRTFYSGVIPSTELNFVSINGQENNTILQAQNRTFVWTRVANATAYQLSIANDSSFTDVFLNWVNISEAEFGSDYYEYQDPPSTWLVSFNLTVNITEYENHYYQVRAFVG